MARPRLRPALRWLHRWLGLTVGTVFAVVALSGSLLLFQPLYFDWAHGEMIPPGLEQEPGSIDAWVENGRAAAPGLGEPIAIWRPRVSHNISDAGMLIFGGRQPGGLGNMGFLAVLVAPSSGAVLGTFDVDRSPAYAPLFLHRDLWAGEAGRVASGLMAIASLVMLAIGLYLWWPGKRGLARKLSPRPWRATLRSARRAHDWFGYSTLLALVVLAATGLYLVRPGWVEPMLAAFPDDPEETRVLGACRGKVGFDAAVAAARDLVPGGTWTALYPEKPGARRWHIALATEESTDAEHNGFWVLADLDCGTVALVQAPGTRSPRDTAELVLTGLHDGSLFGEAGEIVVALLGLVPPLLAVTGVVLWWKMRARRRAAAPVRAGPADAKAQRF